MAYLVRLADRALRDLESIFSRTHAESNDQAFAWFGGLAKAIFSLERFPNRGAVARERRTHRQLLFGRKPHVYRIIYCVDEKNRTVSVVHIRHCAMKAVGLGDA